MSTWTTWLRAYAPGGVPRQGRTAAILSMALAAAALAAAPAKASVGYELNTGFPSQTLDGGVPHGIAVDQTSHRIYVAIVTTNPFGGAPGEIDRFESSFSAAGTFSAGTEPFYSGVAVNQATQAFYGVQARVHAPFGTVGTPRLDPFSSTGTAGSPFSLIETETTLPQIATDSSGDIYYPNAATDKVQVFNAAGAVQEEISCGGCTGGGFGQPASVALDSADNLYVVDLNPDRVIKMVLSAGHYVFSSVLQSGKGAVAVGVDTSDNTVLVGDLLSGKYHIVAYNSLGTQFDDFGSGVFTQPPPAEFGPAFAGQIAVDATSHRVYVGEKDRFFIFNRVATAATPTASTEPASPVGQLTATLRASVNAGGHAALECEFEYTDHADFQANGFNNATVKPCGTLPDGTSATKVSVKATGLAQTTVYHYRVSATTNAGTATSTGQTFETLPVLPATVTTEPAQSVTSSTATLAAKVNPKGGTASVCRFEYGPTTSYGKTIACPILPEAVSTDVAENRNVTGLTTGTTYHYRLVVTTNAGTTQGNDVSFVAQDSTSPPDEPSNPGGDPPASPPAIVLPPTTPPPTAHPLRCRKGFVKKRVKGKVKCVKKKKRVKRRRTRR